MKKVISADGTVIAYDRLGDGPAVVLVSGDAADRVSNAPLAALLAENFTVYNYDRRGHGDSGNAGVYEIEREFEDLDAILAVAGGSAHLFGISSGAALALLATATGRPVNQLAVCEPPYFYSVPARAVVKLVTDGWHRTLGNRQSEAVVLAPALKECFA
jgi:pimeloyl-ACP methyl ester carboxylesterase